MTSRPHLRMPILNADKGQERDCHQARPGRGFLGIEKRPVLSHQHAHAVRRRPAASASSSRRSRPSEVPRTARNCARLATNPPLASIQRGRQHEGSMLLKHHLQPLPFAMEADMFDPKFLQESGLRSCCSRPPWPSAPRSPAPRTATRPTQWSVHRKVVRYHDLNLNRSEDVATCTPASVARLRRSARERGLVHAARLAIRRPSPRQSPASQPVAQGLFSATAERAS